MVMERKMLGTVGFDLGYSLTYRSASLMHPHCLWI
jgi:hypothetical protein